MKVEFARDIEPILEHGGPISDKAKETLRLWISQGAVWPGGVSFPSAKIAAGAAVAPAGQMDFARDVEPILAHGGSLTEPARETLSKWVAQGAVWPAEAKLGPAKGGAQAKDMEVVEQIHMVILAASKEQAEADMKVYTNTIPGTSVTYAMAPIAPGEFLMGSPATEAKRNADEGPQHGGKIGPFWMEQCEVTWDEYELFMYPEDKPAAPADGTTNYTSEAADAVPRPTKPYVEMSFGMGKEGYPAISMTQHVLPMAQRQDRPFLPPADGGGVGIRLPRRHHDGLFLRRRPGPIGRVRLVRRQQQFQISKSRQEKAQSLGPLRHHRQRHRMDPGPIRPQLL